MKTTSYTTYKSNGFTLKYYTKPCIQDEVYYGEYVIAYHDGHRVVKFSTSEKRGLYEIICDLSDEERRHTTDAYIQENAARMGVAPYIVEAHIDEMQKKNSRAAAPAPKLELTAADIALYDYALGGAPVDGYTIGNADAVLKLMKKAGITPAAVDRARKKMKIQQPAPAAPVVEAPAEPAADAVAAPATEPLAVVWTDNMDDAITSRTADACPLPDWAVDGVRCTYTNAEYGHLTGTACRFRWVQVCHCWLCDFSNEKITIDGAVVDNIKPLAAAEAAEQPAAAVVDAPADDATTPATPVVDEQPAAPSGQKTETTPTGQKTAADEYIETGAYPIWYVRNLQIEHVYNRGKYMGTATENIGTVVSWGRKQIKVAWVTGKKNVYTIRDFFEMVESGKFIVSMPYNAEYMAKYHATLNQKQPTSAPAAADAQPAASDTKESHEAIKQPTGADAFAEAITAYCAAMEEPAVPVCYPEVIILKEQPAASATDAAPAHRARRRLNIIPRLSRWLHPARWVAVAFVVCLLCGLLLGTNASTAADATTDDIAAVHELPTITVTASGLTTAPAAPSTVKKLAAPSPVKKAATAAATPSDEKTATDIATASAPAADDAHNLTTAPATATPTAPVAAADGLTICAGTAWAHTMMNWA